MWKPHGTLDGVEAAGSMVEVFMVSLMQLKLEMDVAEVAGSCVKHFAAVEVFMVPLMQLRPRLVMLVGCLLVWQGGLQGLATFADVFDVLDVSHSSD